MRNYDNTDPIFVEVPPDWAMGVKVVHSHNTMMNMARAGLEQRERGRRYSTRRITFQRRGLSLIEWQARFQRVLAEMQSTCILPFWNEGLDAIRQHSGTLLRVQAGKTLRGIVGGSVIVANQFWQVLPPESFRPELWRDCPYVYLSNGTEGYFASVLSIRADLKATLRGGAGGSCVRLFHPFSRIMIRTARMGPIVTPPATQDLVWDEARIYPCFECRRVPDQEDQLQSGMQSRDETLIFETL